MARAESVAQDKTIPVSMRFFATIQALNLNESDGSNLIDYMNRPQNALMREKANRSQLKEIPPLLTEIIQDGIAAGVFQTDYPYETVEMLIAAALLIFDESFLPRSEEETQKRIEAFIYNIERLLGAKAGSFDEIRSLIQGQA